MSGFKAPPTPVTVERPRKGRVLVLAPHPDDETFGPGGTLVHHSRQGDPIHAVFVCSGIQGDPDGLFPREELAAMREKEARAAGAVLGIERFTFFGYPDNLSDADYSHAFGDLPKEPEAQRRALVSGLAQKLVELIAADRPDVVYYPWIGEINPDHWAVGKAVEQVRETQPAWAARISFLGYEIWSACPADVIVDTSDTLAIKLRAVSEYKTQLAYRNFDPIVCGLGAYRSLLLESGATYGEGFVGTYLP
jgi:LmbE family N-acetylglucosaminyl deacetylase